MQKGADQLVLSNLEVNRFALLIACSCRIMAISSIHTLVAVLGS
jgi:hypothetical protein